MLGYALLFGLQESLKGLFPVPPSPRSASSGRTRSEESSGSSKSWLEKVEVPSPRSPWVSDVCVDQGNDDVENCDALAYSDVMG